MIKRIIKRGGLSATPVFFMLSLLALLSASTTSSASPNRNRHKRILKNIAYKAADTAQTDRNMLDVYLPKKPKGPVPVIVFFHGGSWKNGGKDTYTFLGKRFAAKGKIAVIVNYRLAPKASLSQIAADCAAALLWVRDSIKKYGGRPDRISVMGHSAGGYNLAYLINYRYFEDSLQCKNPIYAAVFNDAFALDMHWYLSRYKSEYERGFYPLFSDNEKGWKRLSPAFSPVQNTIRYLVLCGKLTYPSIKESAAIYYENMRAKGNIIDKVNVPLRRHVGMIVQFYLPWNKQLKRVNKFME